MRISVLFLSVIAILIYGFMAIRSPKEVLNIIEKIKKGLDQYLL